MSKVVSIAEKEVRPVFSVGKEIHVDLSFPKVDPNWDEKRRMDEAVCFVQENVPYRVTDATVAGEPYMALCIVACLQRRGIRCWIPVITHKTELQADGTKVEVSEFIRWLQWPEIMIRLPGD